MTDKAAEKKYPGKSPNIKVADLLDLVKEDAEKYIQKRENVLKASLSGRNSAENQTETENFPKWYGDWQNDPAKTSKVVN